MATIQQLCDFIRAHGHQAQPTAEDDIAATCVVVYRNGQSDVVIERIYPTLRDVRNWLGY